MIYLSDNTVFDVDADCIVNTVNCDGFMGKGLALEFAVRYPALEKMYKDDCARGKVKVGNINLYDMGRIKIINFPTKNHFKYPSKLNWIENGLIDFANKYKLMSIKRVAFPILGGANGGLNHDEVLYLMDKYLSNVDIEVVICKSKNRSNQDEKLIKNLNAINIFELKDDLRLNEEQMDSIIKAKKEIYFFSELLKYPKIGIQTYKKLYSYLLDVDKKEYNLFTV